VKKFRFRLEKALKMREWAEGEAKIELGRAVGELSALEKSVKANALARNAAGERRFTGGDALNMVYENYLARLESEKEALLKKTAEAESKVEAARTVWTDAKAALKTMENLKERRFKEYRKDALAEEEKQLEEARRSDADCSGDAD
jgi:flagellar FliJ protein